MDVLSSLASFALVAGVLTLTPGLDTALVLRAAVIHGRKHALVTGLGVIAGAFVWGAAAAVGVSALLSASRAAYTALRIAGACYMLWLGVNMIRRTLRRRRAGADEEDAAPLTGAGARETGLRGWTRGLTTNLVNPKVGFFYIAMLPQFLPEGVEHLTMGLLLALVHALESAVWFAALAFGTALVRGRLQRPSVRRGIDRVTGTVLVGFGLNLALTSR